MVKPKLRFEAFNEELLYYKLRDIVIEKMSNGIINKQSDKITDVKHINVINMYSDNKIDIDELNFSAYDEGAVRKCNVEVGDIFLTRSSVKADGIAKANILLDDGIYVYDDHLIRIKVDENKHVPRFVNYYLASSRFRKQFIIKAKTTAFTTIGQDDIASCAGYFPRCPEQQKIADFLSSIDAIIDNYNNTIKVWEKRKKGIMQKLFSQKVRFKADDGSDFPDWKKKKLGDVFKISTETNENRYRKQNVLSVSEEYGVVNQIELLGRSFAGHDISNYKVVKTGQIIYTRSPIAIKPFGIIKIVDEEIGIVSPLYIVNDVNKDNCSLFWYYNFDTPERTNNYLKPLVRIGAKHTMNISNEEWLSGKVEVPCLTEQQKIANCLSALDDVIDNYKVTVDKWKELKKGLLQQMFV